MMIEQPPELDIDKKLGPVGANGKVERRIIWNLLAHLGAAGWQPVTVHEDEDHHVADAKAAMEWIFNLDLCWVSFQNGSRSHRVFFVLGNGEDVISDWTISRTTDFNDLMESFKANDYA